MKQPDWIALPIKHCVDLVKDKCWHEDLTLQGFLDSDSHSWTHLENSGIKAPVDEHFMTFLRALNLVPIWHWCWDGFKPFSALTLKQNHTLRCKVHLKEAQVDTLWLGNQKSLCKKYAFIDRLWLKHPLKTSSKTTFRFYISSPQQS